MQDEYKKDFFFKAINILILKGIDFVIEKIKKKTRSFYLKKKFKNHSEYKLNIIRLNLKSRFYYRVDLMFEPVL
jgi:hypothetical protein